MRKSNVFNNIRLYIKNRVFIKRNYKIIFSIGFIIISILFGLCVYETSFRHSKAMYNEGEYMGVAHGYHSDIEVKIKTNNYRIIEIEVTNHKEMPVISEVVFKDIPKKVIKRNSTSVDLVSGATYTSKGLIEALDDAISKALVNKLGEE